MQRILVVVAVLAIGACGKKKNDQSLESALRIMCATDVEAGVDRLAPAERAAAKFDWIDARLTNREARDVFVRFGDMSPTEQVASISRLVAKANLKECPALDEALGGGGVPPDLAVPALAASAAGAVPLDDAPRLTVVASKTAIVIEGNAVVALENMLPPASEREGGAAGRMIPRVREMAKALVAAQPPGGRPFEGARVLLHPDAPYELLFQLVFSIKSAGVKRFDIVARREGKIVAIPIELPEMAPDTGGDPGKPSGPGLIVAVTKDRMIIFSTSGTEGTISAPKLATNGVSTAEIARVQETLADIRSRHTDERRIVVMFDGAIAMQLVAETLAAVRARPDGSPLFTDVVLSAGFE